MVLVSPARCGEPCGGGGRRARGLPTRPTALGAVGAGRGARRALRGGRGACVWGWRWSWSGGSGGERGSQATLLRVVGPPVGPPPPPLLQARGVLDQRGSTRPDEGCARAGGTGCCWGSGAGPSAPALAAGRSFAAASGRAAPERLPHGPEAARGGRALARARRRPCSRRPAGGRARGSGVGVRECGRGGAGCRARRHRATTLAPPSLRLQFQNFFTDKV